MNILGGFEHQMESGVFRTSVDPKIITPEFVAKIMHSLGHVFVTDFTDSLGIAQLKADSQETKSHRAGLSPKALPLHTDGVTYPQTPRYVALVLAESEYQGGNSLLKSSEAVLSSLSAEAFEVLSTYGLYDVWDMKKLAPTGEKTPSIFKDERDHWRLKFRREAIDKAYLEESPLALKQAFGELTALVDSQEGLEENRLRAGDLVIIDNHRYLHGRTEIVHSTRRRLFQASAA